MRFSDSMLLTTYFLPLTLACSTFTSAESLDIADEESGLAISLVYAHHDSTFLDGKSEPRFLPFIEAYWGPLFISGTRAGSFITGTDHWSINLSIGIEDLKSREYDDSPRFKDLKNRDRVYDLALNGEVLTNWGDFELALSNDVSNRHKGTVSSASYAYPWEWGRHGVTPSIEVVWMSGQVARYYYGVKPDEQNSTRAFYRPQAATEQIFELHYAYRLSEQHIFFASAALSRYSSEITNSPLVDKKQSRSVSLGYCYSF